MAKLDAKALKHNEVAVVRRLIALTQSKSLVWKPLNRMSTDPYYRITDAYETTYGKFRLLLERAVPDAEPKAPDIFGLPGPFLRLVQHSLSLIDSGGQHLWTVTSLEVLKDLLQMVKYEASNVNDFFEEILKED